jgi:hypothetical protein
MFRKSLITPFFLTGVMSAQEVSPKLTLPDMPEPKLGPDSMVKTDRFQFHQLWILD